MTDEKEHKRETIDGVDVLIYPNGAIKRADNGHWIKPPNGGSITTSERARELQAKGQQMRRAQGIRSKLLGMVKGAGLDIDQNAPDEELIETAGSALEVFTAHMGKTFLKSNNIRGMGEVFPKLTDPFNPPETTQEENKRVNDIEALTELVKLLKEAIQPESIEGKVIK